MVTTFFRRFIRVLMLDPAAFEEVEADRWASVQSAVVVTAVCAAAGLAVLNAGTFAPQQAFAIGVSVTLGAWIVWVLLISVIGTTLMPEAQTRSSPAELFRTLGFAAAPGVFYAFAALPAAAPFIAVFVSLWMIAAAVIAVRQALDYRSTARAIGVCVIAWLVAIGVMLTMAGAFTTTVYSRSSDSAWNTFQAD